MSTVIRHCVQRAAAAGQPQRRPAGAPACRAGRAGLCWAGKKQQPAADLQDWPPADPAELGEQDADPQAATAAAAAAPPPQIIEDFTNFTPDPPGHRAGFVAIIGRPNAGKSTLMNALLGQSLSIVTHKAQTTRHRVLGILSEPHFQAVFLDTPGIINRRNDKLEERMMAAVQQAVKDAECLLAIVDASYQAEEALAMIQPGDDWSGPPMAVLLNKTDLLDEEQLAELKQWYQTNCKADAVFAISALQSNGLDPVREWLVSKLPESPSLYPKDIVSELPERFFVAEIIRKHVFLQYRQEVPYGVTVDVVNYRERQKGKDLVEAEVVVDKERQRGIIIGKAGSALKALGAASRAEIEEFLGRPVYLSISVKVREGWRKDAQQLERMGY